MSENSSNQQTEPKTGKEPSKWPWVLVASLIGSLYSHAIEGRWPDHFPSLAAQLLGGATALFLVAIIVSSFVRGWAGVVTGILVVAAWTFLGTSSSLRSKEEQQQHSRAPYEGHAESSDQIGATHVAGDKEYQIPEIGGTLSLSSNWIPADASITKAQNDDMLRIRPQATTRYILGFTRGKPPNGFYSSADYIWIQRTPMSNPPITPEQLAAMVPMMMAKNKPEMERLLKDRIETVDPGAAHYQQRVGAVVWDSSPTVPSGAVGKMRSYLILTKTSIISINVYSTPETADTVFEEVQGIVSTLRFKEDQKMPQAWTERVKELLGGGK